MAYFVVELFCQGMGRFKQGVLGNVHFTGRKDITKVRKLSTDGGASLDGEDKLKHDVK